MNEWKQAYRLASFEIKASIRSLVLLLAFYIIASILFMQSFDVYLNGEFEFFDLMFLMIFFLFPVWMKNKEFQMQKLDGDLWTSPSIVMLQQLPVTQHVIVKSRFIIHAICSFPLQLVLLVSMPLLSETFSEMMTPLAYAAFVLIWFALSIAGGFIMAASEAGGNFNTKAVVMSFVYLIVGLAVIYFLLQLTNEGFVYWTMLAAVERPVISGLIAIILIVAGWKYWQRDMKKSMKRTDYL